MPDRIATSAIILAGGASRRFGTDKASMQWRGKRLVDHVADTLRSLSDEIILVTVAGHNSLGWPETSLAHDDPELPAGPLRGLVAGLEACHHAWAWTVACDTPLVQPALLHALRAAAGDSANQSTVNSPAQAVIPHWQGRLQPLVACWATNAVPQLRKLLTGGLRSPTAALAHIKTITFAEPDCRHFDPDGLSFLNVNTPEDLARLPEE